MTTVPKGAKVPTDRKPRAKKAPAKKAAPAKDETPAIEVELRGRTWSLEFEAMNDFELIGDLSELDRARDPRRFPAILRRFLGDRQFFAAMELLRDKETGRVTVEAGSEFLMEMFEALDPNFSSSRDS